MKFEEFKQSFYARVNDLSVFDAGEMNLLKTVLDGLKVNYVKRGAVRVILFRSFSGINFYFFLQRLRSAIGGKKSGLKQWVEQLRNSFAKHLLIDPTGRTMEQNGTTASFYFGNIIPVISRNNCCIVAEGTKKHASDIDFNIADYNLALAAEFGDLNVADKKLIERLRACYEQIQEAEIFYPEELQNIAVAFQQFFIRYRVWNRIASARKFESALLWPHYHREGCIHALREAGVKIIELQHGLIAPQDIFYVLPEMVKPVSKRALFADEIWVYGAFWKEQLLKGVGYNNEQIKVKGYFPLAAQPDAQKLSTLQKKFAGKKVILITTQTFLSEYFCAYISFLSTDIANTEYTIVVKLHPAENVADYSSLNGLPNVEIINENLEILFRIAVMNISIYSTTLFDGLRFNVPGFAIWNERFSDYISFFRDSGVIRVIQPDENPVRLMAGQQRLSVEHFYEQFDPAQVQL